MPSRKHRYREAWKKRISALCWPEALKPGTTEAGATAAPEDQARTKLTLDHGNHGEIMERLDVNDQTIVYFI